MYDEQLCWSCKKACGGCLWSAFLKPVKGWEAESTVVIDNRYISNSYSVKSCPEYEYDGICLRCIHYNPAYPEPKLYHTVCKFCHSKRKSGDCTKFRTEPMEEDEDEKS